MCFSVLTPCVLFSDDYENEHLTVYLGKSAINETDNVKEQTFKVEKVILHQNFSEMSYDNDIGEHKHHSVCSICLIKR